MTYVFLTEEPLNADWVFRQVETSNFGAIVTFTGQVRQSSRNREVRFLEYDAYRELAVKQINALGKEATERWGVKCAIAHRLGRVNVGECSIAIAVGAVHRAEAFEACRWLMDSLKSTVPIWKKEFYDGGAHWIEGAVAYPSTQTSNKVA